MKISEANEEDIPQLCELLDLLFSQEAEFQPNHTLQSVGLQKILASPDMGRILVLREGASIIGMVNVLFSISTALGGPVALLEDMILAPEYRGDGAGSKLLQAAVELARSAGCRRITLLTDQSNIPAQRFYVRHGFTASRMIPMRLILGKDG